MYALRRITAADAERISRWRYPEPYGMYNGDPSSVAGLLEPRYRYHAVTDANGDLVGYFCFGPDATISEGRRLGLYADDALDVGLGMRPDLAGQGLGLDFVLAGLDFARETYAPSAFRLTVAAFNRRAVKVYERAGFQTIREFGEASSRWLLMVRPEVVDEADRTAGADS